ncbi:plasma protease C1 inhibitor [Pholidichthys leucotaenia]
MSLKAVLYLLLQLIFELSSCTQIQVIPGSKVELPCKNVSSSVQLSKSARVVENGLYLSMSPVTAANEGEYECLVNEDNAERIRKFNIKVAGFNAYTMKVYANSDAYVPCNFLPSSQVKSDAVWFKETSFSSRMMLDFEDDSTDKKRELLYPGDHDQTLLIRRVAMEDAGIYHCESPEGEKLSTVHIFVEVAPTPPPQTCEGFTTAWEPCQDENTRTGEPMLQESMAEFSMLLYSHLRESNPSNNLLFSPVSISGVLSHLLLGARGETRRAIETAVRVPHDFHCVHHQMKRLREKLASSLQMASQIYYSPQMNLSESFTNQSIQFYDAEPTKLLESSEENAHMINRWVAEKTKNKITHLVDSISPSVQLMLLNAVSFNGQWKVKFEEKPKKGFFTKLNGDLVKVPLLYHQNYNMAVMYVDELKAKVARFPLTGDSSLYILLPQSQKKADLQEVEERMTDAAVLQMIQQIKAIAPQKTEVTLPQIKLDVQPDMNILIKKLGLSSLFESANLCGLYVEGKTLFLDDAKHRAFLALTEQGVEAGAITTLSFSRSYFTFSALRPFILLLWSDQANVPLFVGRVTDP